MTSDQSNYREQQAINFLAGINAPAWRFRFRQWLKDDGGNWHDQPSKQSGGISASQLITQWPEFTRRNAKRADIFVWPHWGDSRPHVVLLDDITLAAARQIWCDLGIGCLSALVESSPDNYQAWVGVPDGIYPADWQRVISARYGADAGGHGLSQPARLPGLSNRKPKHIRPDGNGPWIRLVYVSHGSVAYGATPAAAAAADLLLQNASPTPVTATRQQATKAAGRPASREGGASLSQSERDWAWACRHVAMLRSRTPAAQREGLAKLAATLRQRRPDKEARSPGYAARTISNAARKVSINA